jgi:hypothetical protein
MRKPLFAAAAFVAAVVLVGLPQITPAQQPGQVPPPAPPKAYKPVAIQLPKPLGDPSFDAFRKQLAAIAQKKDRAALARLMAKEFFWIPEDKDIADKKKSGIDNFAKALGLDGRDASGWEVLVAVAGDPTAQAHPDRKGVVCTPGEPSFDEKALEEVALSTQTDAGEWGYPIRDGVQVRAGAQPNSAALEKLGLHLVRVYPEETANPAAADATRIVTPSGKVGYVQWDLLHMLLSDQVCYVKEGNAWKVAGVIGGDLPNP